MGEFIQTAYQISVWAIPVLIAITFHEAAHGWAAWKLGDPHGQDAGPGDIQPDQAH